MTFADRTVTEPAHDAGGGQPTSADSRSRARRGRDTEHRLTRAVRLGLGHTRDVSMIEGDVPAQQMETR
jgi:hypothetical protein